MTIAPLELTGERTVPGVDLEQYWFRRHEVVYRWLAQRLTVAATGPGPSPGPLVDAGCGEGYGADLLAAALTAEVIGLDYDAGTIAHVAAAYPRVWPVRGNLATFPLASATVPAVVSLQVIEHLWDLGGFLAECRRVLVTGGAIAVSTPNRPVFSPGLARGAKPTNPFHVEEFDAEQVTGMLTHAGFCEVEVLGLHHGPRLQAWEADHGSLVTAHVTAVVSGAWPDHLLALLPTITIEDFRIGAHDEAHDLIGVGRR
ncbi:MAG: hypothetical protein QG597_517 [Actinomycetota bacterium]|nr:hypothetical protein [Actinomycetota bacterium]